MLPIRLVKIPALLLGLAVGVSGLWAGERHPQADPLPPGAIAQFGSPRLQDPSIDRVIAFSPDGKLLATGGANSPICVWDRATGKRVRTYINRRSVYDLRWKPDGKLAALTFFGPEGFLTQEFGGGNAKLDKYQDLRLRELALVRELQVVQARLEKTKPDRLQGCFLSSDGRKVLAVWFRGPKNSRRAALYPFDSFQPSDSMKPVREIALPDGYGVWLSGDGKCLLAHVQPAAGQPNRLIAFDLTAAKDKNRPAWELTFPGPQQDSRPDVCLSPDGKRVVILFWDDHVELWDGPSGKRLRELPKLPRYYHHHNSEARGLDLASDGKRLALIDRDTKGQVGGRIVDVTTGEEVCRLARRSFPRLSGSARFSPDGKWVACISYGVVGIWNAHTGGDACSLPGHRGGINSLAVLAGGKKIVTSGDDLTVRAWEAASGKEFWRAPLRQVGRVIFATPDGAIVVQEPQEWVTDRLLLCLDAASGKPRPLPGKLAAATRDTFLACSSDGTKILSLDTKQPAFRVWSWPAGELWKSVPLVPPRKLRLAQCVAAEFTPDNKGFVALVYYYDLTDRQVMPRTPAYPFVETWNLAAGKLLGRIELKARFFPNLMPHPSGPFFLDIEKVRDAITGAPLVQLHVHEGRAISLAAAQAALSPDGRTVAISAHYPDQQLLLCEARTGRCRQTLPVPDKEITRLSFLPDGRLATLGSTALVWSVNLQPAPGGERLGARDLAGDWERLGGADPEKTWPVMRKLAGAPAAVALLRKHVRAVPRLSEKSLERIFHQLDAPRFKDREAAKQELDHLGSVAVPRVKAKLAAGVSLELQRRLEIFLARYGTLDLPPEELRARRAVEVLESLGTPAARKLLGELAAGEPTAPLTQEAAASLARLGRR
jgi:WD40 repeat protein